MKRSVKLPPSFQHLPTVEYYDMVGPVGFEPTTSGPETLNFLGTPAPQVHRAHTCALVSCWRNRVPRPSCPEIYCNQSLLDDGPIQRKHNCALIISFHSNLKTRRTFSKVSTETSRLYVARAFRVLPRFGNMFADLSSFEIRPKRKY
jgi:hypothetical protein